MNCKDCKQQIVGKPAGSYIPERKHRTYWSGRPKQPAHWCGPCWAKREAVCEASRAKSDAETREQVRKVCVDLGIDPKTVLGE